MDLPSQNMNVSNDPETKGFDLSAGNTWIYPENYPVRDYQYNIVKKALYYNTLVCLPTGLGKTFIAAVVMYNFWRWYPFGKIVFLAPTKPLVAQQIDACFKIMGIPSIDTMELTGAVNKKTREISWSKKRIIFATPQVFHNDLEKSIVPSHLVKCVVIDEAHRSLGKHSYCECIRMLSMQHQYFRILALSATPGNKLDKVHEVIRNLHISHLELREENSIDIMPYINKRKVDIIMVPLSNELAKFKEKYIVIMDRHVKILIQYNVLHGLTANISKGRIFHLLREFKTKTDTSGNYKQIMITLNILLTMYHAYELMIRHGLRAFCRFYQTHSDKFWMHNERQLQELLRDIEIYLGPFPDVQSYSVGDVSEVPKDLVFGHNKFHKLKELLEHHFKSNNDKQKNTRAIVFVEYRDIVNEVYILLLQSKPIIRPQMFVGQAGQKQKQQIKALEDFKSNRVNVLISTSIGEEGLDVGEVDLIICFDVSQHSPIRLVQRMGRTGRRRDGHIIVLVTDGKEHENLKSTLSKRASLNNKILNTSNIFSSFYENNFRMIPNQFTPECHKIYITELSKTPTVKSKRKKKIIHKKSEMCNTKQKDLTQKNTDQSSMRKFLTNNKYNEQNNTWNISSSTTQSNNLRNTVKLKNVKLLSDDNMGIDFLTLCAVKKSEEDISSETVHKMDTHYIPISKPVTNLLDFTIPDMKILDCLSFLNVNLDGNLSTSQENCENKNITIDIDIDDNNFWCTIRNEADNGEIKFENILDESSDSDKTTFSHLSHGIADKIDLVNTVNTFITKDHEITFTEAKSSNTTLNDIEEPSLFENILNDSFSSIEDNLENKKPTQEITSPINSNILEKDTDNNTYESVINHFRNDNIDKLDRRKTESTEIEKSDQTNEVTRCFIDEMQDFDFNNENNINDISSQNKSSHNTKAEESLLSITQAIGEIAQMKKDMENSSTSLISKKERINETNSDWISVNTKRETKITKKNSTTETENKLSNFYHNSAKSDITTQLNDFDEDFIITKDSAKRFDELESSYFRNTSKNSEFKNTCNASENIELYNPSTSTNKPLGLLSLKKNITQNLHVKNPSICQTSTKCMQNKQNKNISKCPNSPSYTNNTSEQKSSLSKKTTQDKKYKHKITNKFIDDEAQVYSDASSDETIESDEDLTDFVSYTQNIPDQIDMHAHYLQTTKSPIKKTDGFHFKKLRPPDPNMQIYTQPLSQTENSYLYDSFCVDEDVEPSMLAGNDSFLEKAEEILRQNKRKYHSLDEHNIKQTSKRKRIYTLNNSVSSEDEMEQLRIQLQKD